MAKQWRVQSGKRSRKLISLGVAAGGMIAGSHAAEGGVIYTNANQTLNNPGSITIDLNNDNTFEGNLNLTNPDGPNNLLNLSLNLNANAGVLAENNQVNPLNLNDTIGPDGNFLTNNLGDSNNFNLVNNDVGPFNDVTNGFIGFRFSLNDNSHFGWARISVSDVVTLHDFAYENTPNTAINAGDGIPVPEPGTLALLAAGATGLLAWRLVRARAAAKSS